ncbi:hypothetical protein CPC08DRAFT_506963 [Agrocybe pediades]|nr:hypothetical protein CPC08DRAFT_506963 [Agrocybe pediades]
MISFRHFRFKDFPRNVAFNPLMKSKHLYYYVASTTTSPANPAPSSAYLVVLRHMQPVLRNPYIVSSSRFVGFRLQSRTMPPYGHTDRVKSEQQHTFNQTRGRGRQTCLNFRTYELQ